MFYKATKEGEKNSNKDIEQNKKNQNNFCYLLFIQMSQNGIVKRKTTFLIESRYRTEVAGKRAMMRNRG